MARPMDFSGLPAKTSGSSDDLVNYGIAVQGLSNEQLDLLNKCRHDGLAFGEPPTAPKLRTGHITVEELIGGNGNGNGNDALANIPIMERLKISRPVTSKTIFDSAAEHVPLVPGFPIPMRIQNRGDMGFTSTMFRPELFKTTIEAYGSAYQQQAQENQGGSDLSCMLNLFKGLGSSAMEKGRRGNFNYGSVATDYTYSPEPDLIPWESPTTEYNRMSMRNERSKPKFSHSTQKVSQMRSNGPQRGGHGGQYANRGTPSNNAYGSHSGTNQGQNQKAKKSYFMSHMCREDVERGLADPRSKLFEGVLRVNQRNYEESYIDNPKGDLDLLILGVHDRNRALHGDLVVVRIKERENWVVLNGPYKAWRQSHQSKEAKEDEKKIVEQNESSMFNVTGLSVSASSVTEPVPISQSMCYSRANLIHVAVQMEMATPKSTDTQKTRLALKPDIQTMLVNLGINKSDDVDSDPTSLRRLSSSQRGVMKAPTGTGPQNKRSSMRTLADLPEDSKIVPDSCLQKTAEVVFIAQQKNGRTAMGQLKVMADGNRNWALFSPTDPRMPRMMLPADQLPPNFFERPQDYQKYLFVAKMVDWAPTAQFARGKLERHLGLAGDIDTETEGLLLSNSIDTKEFSPLALSSLPITESSQWRIEEKEFKYRVDLRDELIFTIDPVTARDLDDALHIKPCADIDGNGTHGWEIGVHIADVTHFLLENSELDNWARERATSTYLVHKVIPMLPRLLCEELCSLNAGVDRLCFSVIWKMSEEGEIFDEKFARTIIRSRCKLAYEHAQEMLENPDKEFAPDELPPISDGCTSTEISTKVQLLWNMAKKMKTKRQDNGALRLDQPKLKFALDSNTNMPTAVGVYVQRDANRLVEEYMLLANMRVAKKIEESFPETSVLRRHPAPKAKVLAEAVELCEKIGFPIDATSSKLLSEELRRFEGKNEVQSAINQVLSMIMMRPMQLAQYFCTGAVKSQSDYYHYALATPFYTHFTSPIRRYPDVMVHRLLSAACGYTPPPTLADVKEIAKVCGHCNDKKTAAKTVSEASADTFFGLFVKHVGTLEEKGVVVAVLDASFDVLVFKYGVVKRVYVNRLDMARDPEFHENAAPPRLTLYWKSKGGVNPIVVQEITICTVVEVVLTALPEPTKYQAVIKMQPTAEAPKLSDLLAADVENLGTDGEASISNEDNVLDMRAETIFADLD